MVRYRHAFSIILVVFLSLTSFEVKSRSSSTNKASSTNNAMVHRRLQSDISSLRKQVSRLSETLKKLTDRLSRLEATVRRQENRLQKFEQQIQADRSMEEKTDKQNLKHSISSAKKSETSPEKAGVQKSETPLSQQSIWVDKPRLSYKIRREPLDREIIYVATDDTVLSKLAHRYYRDASFWEQIYQVNKNKLPSPDVVPPGTRLRLPPLNELK